MKMSFFKSMIPIDSIIDMVKKSIMSKMETTKKENSVGSVYYVVSSDGAETMCIKEGKHETISVTQNYSSLIFDDEMLDMLEMVKMQKVVDDTNKAIDDFFKNPLGKDSKVFVYVSKGEILVKFKNEEKVTDIDVFSHLKDGLKERLKSDS
jgi:hypothetical protein